MFFHGCLVRQRILSSVGGGDIGPSMPCGGWEAAASGGAENGVSLNKMDNGGAYGAGRARDYVGAEGASGGGKITQQAWNTVARPFLTQKWSESEGKWKQSQSSLRLREHYYKQLDDDNVEGRSRIRLSYALKTLSQFSFPVLLKLMPPKKSEFRHR